MGVAVEEVAVGVVEVVVRPWAVSREGPEGDREYHARGYSRSVARAPIHAWRKGSQDLTMVLA